ncbi:MAG: hypothetical protein IIB89_01285 [Chloroflexi bacterium]|nr:hypothetical protein [Chloroflexota bacterium]
MAQHLIANVRLSRTALHPDLGKRLPGKSSAAARRSITPGIIPGGRA